MVKIISSVNDQGQLLSVSQQEKKSSRPTVYVSTLAPPAEVEGPDICVVSDIFFIIKK